MQPSAEEVIAVARSFRNVVIEGPPGTGKTYLLDEIAQDWQARTGRELGGDARGKWAITLHPSTSYEDFIGGLRADEDGFTYRPGFLQQRVKDALEDPHKDFLVLLDELNRANVPRVLGDAMLTIEASKRLRYEEQREAWGGGLTVTLPSGDVDLGVEEIDGFGIPDNLYILATMNTTDRSVAGLDSALRRRFAFVRLPPMGAADMAQDIEALYGTAIRAAIEPSAQTLSVLNDDLLQPVLGADHVLGHSYLFDAANALDGTRGGDGGAELAVLAEELRTGTTGGRTILEAFWVEVGKSTSVKRNQVDLSKRGRQNPAEGSAHFFLGPQLPAGATTRPVTVEYNSTTYTGSELKYYGGDRANLTWRLNLNGTAGTENIGDLGWTAIRLHALVFLRVGSDHYVMRSLPLSAIAQLSAWGTADQVPASNRQFGRLTLHQAVPEPTPTALRRAWQYALLPQLIDLIAAQGAEALLVSGDRASFLLARGDLTEAQRTAAEVAGTRLDDHLRALGLQVRADGTGLSRTLVVDQAPPHEQPPAPVRAAPEPDAEPNGGDQA
ncbi:dynein-related subfamily AAA family protein [Geodermatophilus tzadiensis]|uniref:Dynein-related subfamily AAA family protein n=1 Tax=Geodermatophilus tzadiensis TaxID=1137988 RepID=A0A2T0TSF5_9ACTN|nr:AAA family ATPase [Geodermatophilus tzadiensis]PRY48624.1 dynein-related subfamily AAA family protein [Geodermatophilus tzadiensis]